MNVIYMPSILLPCKRNEYYRYVPGVRSKGSDRLVSGIINVTNLKLFDVSQCIGGPNTGCPKIWGTTQWNNVNSC
ncbi:unnamed protein product [Tenebrio molitor]|nr:unnamed protein product [Tenebrio molitor]